MTEKYGKSPMVEVLKDIRYLRTVDPEKVRAAKAAMIKERMNVNREDR